MSLRKIFAETNKRQGENENKTAVVNQGYTLIVDKQEN